jgi:hypothetical protein
MDADVEVSKLKNEEKILLDKTDAESVGRLQEIYIKLD